MSPCPCGSPSVILWTPAVGATREPEVPEGFGKEPGISAYQLRKRRENHGKALATAWRNARQPWWPRGAWESDLVPHAGPKEAPRSLCEACYEAAVKQLAKREGLRIHGLESRPTVRIRTGLKPWRRKAPLSIHRAF